MKKIIYLLCLCLLPLGMKGQEPLSFTSDQGLSNTRILSIYEDSRNNVWICTQNGLNRYDGIKMNMYRHETGKAGALAHDIVNCVREVSSGMVLVGTVYGVQEYSYDTDKFTEVPLIAAGGDTLSAHVASIAQVGKDSVFVITSGYGVYRLHKDKRKGKRFEEDKNFSPARSSLRQIFEDRDKRIWFVSIDGEVYCRDKNSLHLVTKCPGAVELCQSSSGTIYLATEHSGLLRYSESGGQFEHVCSDGGRYVIVAVNPGLEGEVLVCTDGEGLKVYNEANGTMTQSNVRTYEYNLAISNVKDAIIDSVGNIWIGVYWKGLLAMPLRESDFNYVGRRSVLKNTIGTNCVTSIIGDGHGDLWLATDHCGVYHLKSDGSSSVHFKPELVKSMPSTVLSMLEASDGNLWIGTSWSGVLSMDRNTGECTPLSATVPEAAEIPNAYALVEDGAKNMWIGSMGGGLFRYNLATHKLTKYSPLVNNTVVLPTQIIRNIYIRTLLVHDGYLYAGTADGMDVFTLSDEGNIKPVSRFLSKSDVYDIKVDADGMLWAATSVGLSRLDPTDGWSAKTYTMADGLPINSVCSVEIAPNGDVWVGTNDGLACLDSKTGKFDNYTINDGIQGNEFNLKASYSQDGEMYFGGINGLTFFRHTDVGKNMESGKPQLRLVDFYVNGVPVHVGDSSGHYAILDRWLPEVKEVNLSSKDRTFSIELSTMDLDNRYDLYYCVNNGDWTVAERGQSRISFVNMDVGVYRIRMKAVAYGVSSDVKELTVRIHSPWFLSPMAMVVYIVLIMFLCYVAFRQIKEHYKAKRMAEQLSHVEELNEARIQFFMNISHEIRTPMTLIINPLKTLMGMDSDDVHVRNYSLIYQNSQRILHLINQMMDIRKIDKGQFTLKYGKVEVVSFVKNLYELFDATARSRNITFTFNHSMERLEACLDPQNFDKVVLNLLSNAFKFTSDGGTVTIDLEESPSGADGAKDFVLSVTDDGVGIADTEKPHVFDRFYSGIHGVGYIGTGIGLNLTRLVVELHGGVISVENNPEGKGTRFKVRMPEALEMKDKVEDYTALQANAATMSDNVLKMEKALPEASASVKGWTSHGYVLVVDDEEPIRTYLQQELGTRFNVVTFSNGEEAFEYIAHNPDKVDLVLSDVMMPVMDGIELCSKIKGSLNVSHILVVLLTAKGDDSARMEGLLTGADAYMSKPFNMEILRQTIENMLKNRSRLQGRYSVERSEKEIDGVTLTSYKDKMMEKVMKVINENISSPTLNVDYIADKVGISRGHFHRRLKEMTGLTPRDFLRHIRLAQATKFLAEKKYDVTDVALAVGFRSVSSFSTSFKDAYGMTPTEYMKSGTKGGDEVSDVSEIMEKVYGNAPKDDSEGDEEA